MFREEGTDAGDGGRAQAGPSDLRVGHRLRQRRGPALGGGRPGRDSATIAGALTAVRSHPASEVLNDPFRRLFRTRLLRVEQGFIADMPSPVGPVIQRYSGSPWPWDRFEA